MSMQGRHKTGQALMHAILALVAIYTLAPLVFLIFNSFKSNNEIVDSPVSAPSSWSFQYKSQRGPKSRASRSDLFYDVPACSLQLHLLLRCNGNLNQGYSCDQHKEDNSLCLC